MDRIVVENDIEPVAVSIVVKGKDLVLDPSMYTVEFELKVKEALKEEGRLMEEDKETDAIRLMTDLFADLVLPANPEWTKEEIYEKCSRQHVGWAYGFFALMAPSGGQVKRELAEKMVKVLLGRPLEDLVPVLEMPGEVDSSGTPKTQDDQTSPHPE